MEDRIRQMLLERAGDITPSPVLSSRTSQRVGRRRILTGAGTVAAIAALAIAGLSVAGALRREPALPVGPSLKVKATFRIGPDPSDLTYGFGSLWYATGDALLRLDPETGRTLARIDTFPLETSPSSGIATTTNRVAVGEGAVWLLVADNGTSTGPATTASPSLSGNRGSFKQGVQSSISAAPSGFREHWALLRIDPDTNVVRASPLVFDSLPVSVAAGGGSVWVATNGYTRTGDEAPGWVSRFDPETLKLRSTFELEATPSHVWAEGGSVWVGQPGPTGRVLRIDPRTGRTVAWAFLRSPGDIVVVDEALWVTTYGDSSWGIASFDKETMVRAKTVTLGKQPEFSSEMTVVGQRLWVIDLWEGTLRWVDTTSGRRGRPEALFDFPAHIASGGNAVWIAGGPTTNGGTIWRVELP